MVLPIVILLISGVAADGDTTKGPQGRILNSTPISIRQAPYQASFQHRGSHFCGASIIGSKWVLTAAHCVLTVRHTKISELSIRAGSTRIDSGGTVHPVQDIHVHPHFSKHLMDYDVSVILVSKKIIESSTTRRVPLIPAGAKITSGERLTVTGWGKTSEKASDLSPVLRTTEVKAVGRSTCKNELNTRTLLTTTRITSRMFCAGGRFWDTCQGDSGGPIVNMRGQQVGIVSWGRGCGREDLPGVYTSIPNLEIRNFIKEISGI